MPCLPGLCTHATDCRDTLCPGHPDGAGEGGRYWPTMFAENNFQHVHAPAPVAVVKQHIAPQDDEPLGFCAKACWAGAISLACLVVAAGIVDWLMSF